MNMDTARDAVEDIDTGDEWYGVQDLAAAYEKVTSMSRLNGRHQLMVADGQVLISMVDGGYRPEDAEELLKRLLVERKIYRPQSNKLSPLH